MSVGLAAVIVDDWKVPEFERQLKANKWPFVNNGKFDQNTTLLKVSYDHDKMPQLNALITKIQTDCARANLPRNKKRDD